MILTIECKLKQMRQRVDMSQRMLADLADVKLSKIWEYETGKATPSVYTLWKMAVVLECKSEEIYVITEINREPIDLIK